MASEWLKIEVNTPEKQEVLAISVALGWADPDIAFSKLFRVWRWFDQHTVEGIAPRLTMGLIDLIAGVPGMAEAMLDVGWLLENDGVLMLSNFDRHNGKTAKERALTAKRVGKFRVAQVEGESDLAMSKVDGVTLPLPIKEKKIKENKINLKTTTKTITATAATDVASASDVTTTTASEKDTAASDDVFPPGIDFQIINDFKALRKKLHLPITKTSLDGLQREGAKVGMNLEAVLKMCCERGWRGFKADWAQDDSVNRERSRKPKFNPVAYVNRNRIRSS